MELDRKFEIATSCRSVSLESLGSVVFRVMERTGRVMYVYRESNPFEDLVTRGINRGRVTRYMFYDGREQFYLLIFAEFPII